MVIGASLRPGHRPGQSGPGREPRPAGGPITIDPRVLPPFGPRAFLRCHPGGPGGAVLNIVSGAAVRLSDSGLGLPRLAHLLQAPPHPAARPPPGHRVLQPAGGGGLAGGGLAVAFLAALLRRPRRRTSPGCSAASSGVIGEAVIGGVRRLFQAQPLRGGDPLHGRHRPADGGRRPGPAGRPGPVGGPVVVTAGRPWLGRAMLAVLVLAIAAGTATTGAGPHAGGKGAKRIPVAPRRHGPHPRRDRPRPRGHDPGPALSARPDRGPERRSWTGPASCWPSWWPRALIGYTQYFTHLPARLVGVHVFGATVLSGPPPSGSIDGLSDHPPEVRPAAARADRPGGRPGRRGGAGVMRPTGARAP